MTDQGSDPTARALRLLALLCSRRTWDGAELARRLGVSPRTLRRDLERLERLDYHVRSRPGPGGYYALEPGNRMPPLTFDDDEVLALVAGLRMVEDRLADDAAARSLAKLLQVLPRRLAAVAREVSVGSETVRRRPADLDLEVLSTLTQAAATNHSVDFDYRDQAERRSQRHVDALRCVHSHGRWYVVGFDTDRDDWRLFRLDRIESLGVGARMLTARDGPADDLFTWFTTDFGRAPGRQQEETDDGFRVDREAPTVDG